MALRKKKRTSWMEVGKAALISLDVLFPAMAFLRVRI